MQALAVSFARKIAAATLAASLTLTLVPFAYADGEGVSEGDAENVASGLPDQSSDSIGSVILSEGTAGPEVEESNENSLTLASSLVGTPSNFINSDVALDGEPVIGSFTVDGLTFAVIDGPYVELVSVSPDWQQVMSSQEGEGSGVAPMLASGPYGAGSEAAALTLPETVSCEGVSHIVSSIGAYAFYLSSIFSITLPASISNVDDRAFRSSDVALVRVADDNPFYSSFDGALYDAEQLSLLLIPEGKQGTVRIPKTAEVAEASVFSHCPLVDAISVDAGSAAFASEDGLLYDSDLTTLLRVPAGATEITIREGCTTIAAGALEACAKLTTINAPASVISISPDVFHAIPTVSLPAVSVILGEDSEAKESNEGQASEASDQLTAMVALSSCDDELPIIEASAIAVRVSQGAAASSWRALGFVVEMLAEEDPAVNSLDQAASSRAIDKVYVYGNGGSIGHLGGSTSFANDQWLDFSGPSITSQGGSFYSVTRPGYKFVTWNPYGYNFRLSSGTHYVTAVWEVDVASLPKITFNGQGGTVRRYYWKDGASSGILESGSSVVAKSNYYRTHTPNTNIFTLSKETPDSGQDYFNATRSGYTFKGWSLSKTGGTILSGPGCTAGTFNISKDTTIYAQWTVKSYTVEYWNKAGSSKLSSDTGFKYDTMRKLAVKPASGLTIGYTAVGWSESAGQSTATYSFGEEVKNLATSGTKKLYLAERAHAYTVTFDSAGGTTTPDIRATYDEEITLPTPTRQGYAFGGWKDEDTGTTYQAGKTKNLTTADEATVEFVAQWSPVISADVPQTVTARMDVLGIEEQAPATGYIESRCGEPLKVARVDLAPLDGAKELFGEGNVSDVFLEVLANNGASPNARFSLGASATETDASKLQAFTMGSYGTRVPISYRFIMAPHVQTSLLEYANPKPVCSVAYTVALESPTT